MEKKNYRRIYVILGICIVGMSAIMIFNQIHKKSQQNNAFRLTTDGLDHGPIVFNNIIYFPSSNEFPDKRNTNKLGRIIPKDNNLIIEIINQDILVGDINDPEYTHLKTAGGDDSTIYSKADFLESVTNTKEVLEKYEKFNLCNDDEYKDVRIPINKEVIVKLEDLFGAVKYNKRDFEEELKIYYIYVHSPMGYVDSLDGEGDVAVLDWPLVYIGCILYDGQNMYYGNRDNIISDDLTKELKDLINKN